MSVQARPHRQTRGTAQDYAQAIYDLALEAWTRQLGHVQQVLKGDAALRLALADASIEAVTRLNRLEQAMPGELSEGVRKFLGTLLEAGQIDQLDAILAELYRLVRRGPERRLALVTSAVPLTSAEQEALRARLIERFGSDLEFRFNVDASLIGGVRLRVGDQVIDGSVSGKLAAMRDRLTA